MKKNRSRNLFDAAHFASMLRLLSLIILCVIVLTSPGCSCSSNSTAPQTEAERKAEEERLAKEAAEAKKKKKPPFDEPQICILPDMIVEKPEKKPEDKPVVQPVDPTKPQADGDKPTFNYYKVRHWASAIERRKSNDDDLPGMELHSTLSGSGGSPTLENQSYTVEFTRPVALAKGKEKYLEYQFFAVPGPSTFLQSELADRRSGRIFNPQTFAMSKMKAHTYHFVILTKDKSKYLRWSKLDVMTRPAEMGFEDDYRVKMPDVKKLAPLPTYFQGWTSTAALVWDGIDPSTLNMEQQNAMRDWLHWGGLLIVNGPTSVDLLKGSFLDLDQEQTLMPYIGHEARTVTQNDMSLINSYWSKCESTSSYNNLVPLKMTKPWNGLEFKKQKQAQWVENTARLVLTRDIGRGRVVVTGFSMAQSDFHHWQGLDGFINGALMGNGPRKFVPIPNSDGMYSIVKKRTGEQTYLANSYLNTRFRILTRDWTNRGFNNEEEENVVSFQQQRAFNFTGNTDGEDGTSNSDTQTNLMSAASWNDTREISAAARDSLGVASGINLPDVSFVIVLLIVYLGVLVVLNYGVFKVLGRVEYAWFAAPVIAIIGSLAVIKLAQLDIGFVRSQTEVAVLECHANHPRAHLTRYTALYSSLSTNYEMKLDDPGGVALPFAIPTRSKTATGRFGATGPTKVTYTQDDQKVQLSGFEVSSNSMSMIHSEQMIDLKGGIRYEDREENRGYVHNDTAYQFENVGVVRRTKAGKLQTGWIGTLLPGGKTIVEYSNQTEANRPDKPILKIDTPPPVDNNVRRFGRRPIAAPVDEVGKDEATKAAEELEKEKKAATNLANYSPLFTQWSKYFTKNDPKTRNNETPIPLANLLQLLSTSHKESLVNGESRMIALIPRQLPGMTISPAAAQSDRSMTIAYVQLTSGSQWIHQRDIDSKWQAKELNPQDDKSKVLDLEESLEQGESDPAQS